MDVHVEVPEELARQLASDSEDLARVALEALAAEGVRSGKLSVFQARESCSAFGRDTRWTAS
jgi:hypothetical protein